MNRYYVPAQIPESPKFYQVPFNELAQIVSARQGAYDKQMEGMQGKLLDLEKQKTIFKGDRDYIQGNISGLNQAMEKFSAQDLSDPTIVNNLNKEINKFKYDPYRNTIDNRNEQWKQITDEIYKKGAPRHWTALEEANKHLLGEDAVFNPEYKVNPIGNIYDYNKELTDNLAIMQNDKRKRETIAAGLARDGVVYDYTESWEKFDPVMKGKILARSLSQDALRELNWEYQHQKKNGMEVPETLEEFISQEAYNKANLRRKNDIEETYDANELDLHQKKGAVDNLNATILNPSASTLVFDATTYKESAGLLRNYETLIAQGETLSEDDRIRYNSLKEKLGIIDKQYEKLAPLYTNDKDRKQAEEYGVDYDAVLKRALLEYKESGSYTFLEGFKDRFEEYAKFYIDNTGVPAVKQKAFVELLTVNMKRDIQKVSDTNLKGFGEVAMEYMVLNGVDNGTSEHKGLLHPMNKGFNDILTQSPESVYVSGKDKTLAAYLEDLDGDWEIGNTSLTTGVDENGDFILQATAYEKEGDKLNLSKPKNIQVSYKHAGGEVTKLVAALENSPRQIDRDVALNLKSASALGKQFKEIELQLSDKNSPNTIPFTSLGSLPNMQQALQESVNAGEIPDKKNQSFYIRKVKTPGGIEYQIETKDLIVTYGGTEDGNTTATPVTGINSNDLRNNLYMIMQDPRGLLNLEPKK